MLSHIGALSSRDGLLSVAHTDTLSLCGHVDDEWMCLRVLIVLDGVFDEHLKDSWWQFALFGGHLWCYPYLNSLAKALLQECKITVEECQFFL